MYLYGFGTWLLIMATLIFAAGAALVGLLWWLFA